MKKKTYQKPQILFESFSLSSSIAANCAFRIDTFRAGDCGVEYGIMGNVFLAGVNGCDPINNGTIVDDGELNGLCYHVPIETMALFNS